MIKHNLFFIFQPKYTLLFSYVLISIIYFLDFLAEMWNLQFINVWKIYVKFGKLIHFQMFFF